MNETETKGDVNYGYVFHFGYGFYPFGVTTVVHHSDEVYKMLKRFLNCKVKKYNPQIPNP